MRRFGQSVSLAAASVVAEEIAPQTTVFCDAVIALPDEKERITQTIARHDLANHLRVFEPREVTHAPVMRYVLKDALVVHNGLFAKQLTYNRWGALDHRKVLFGAIIELDEAAYCLEDRSYLFFGHWLRSFAQCLLADDKAPFIHFPDHAWTHAMTYESTFGLPSLDSGHYAVKELTLFQDFAQSPHKAARYRELRQRMQSHHPMGAAGHKHVYLKRGNTGAARVIVNEDQLEKNLLEMGFDIVDLANTPIEQIFARLSGAEIALTIEGSHADHLHWLIKPGGTLWVLNPSNHFNTSQFAVAQSIENRVACTVIDEVGTSSYEINVKRLRETFNLIHT